VSGVLTAIRGAVAGRRVQTGVVALVALLSTATAVLGAGLLAVSDAPFERAFSSQVGAHVTAAFDATKVTADALVAGRTKATVTATAGPFDAVTVNLTAGPEELGLPSSTVVGRAEPGGPVDRLALDSGRWLAGPGEIVLARATVPPYEGRGSIVAGASTVTVRLPTPVKLRVVGIAHSITGTADAWVWPSQDNVLRASGVTAGRQMLYRFGAAGDAAALQRGLESVTAGLPDGALVGAHTYLASRLQSDTVTGPMVPFVVAFAVLGLVAAVLVVVNVVGGAVVAGYRTIGVLKSLGLTPRQVVVVYIGQVLVPGAVGALLGVGLGNLVAVPVLRQAQRAYDVAADAIVPPWISAGTPVAVLAVIGLVAMGAAGRAGRLPAMQAIAVGRAPRTGRGFRLRRWLAATRLPRPVSFGIGTVSARPGRSVATLLAVAIGAATVVFAVGLASTLNRAGAAFSRVDAVPVEVELDVRGPSSAGRADPARVRAAIAAQPGTAHVVGLWDATADVAGVGSPVRLSAYDGDASWVGYALVTGRWYAGPDEVVASSRLLGVTGLHVGDRLTLTTGQGRLAVRVVGETFDNTNDGFAVVGAATTLAPLAERPAVESFEVGVDAGTVLTHWGIHTTEDFGQIVFMLIEVGLLARQPSDRLEDFERVYEFGEVFKAGSGYRWPGVPSSE